MSLAGRLMPSGMDDSVKRIPIHHFVSAVREVLRGEATVTQFSSAFSLSQADMQQLAAIIMAGYTADEIEDVLTLWEAGKYTKDQVVARLAI